MVEDNKKLIKDILEVILKRYEFDLSGFTIKE